MFPNLGCLGGKQIYAFNYTKNEGLTDDESYPYTDEAGECKTDNEVVFKIEGFKAYNHLVQRDLEKLVCQGVVGVPMRINSCIKHYKRGIIDDRKGLCGCSQRGGPNHFVALVGFGRDIEAKRNGKCSKYWILRNSWTEEWGEDGYFRLCAEEGDGAEMLRDGTCYI